MRRRLYRYNFFIKVYINNDVNLNIKNFKLIIDVYKLYNIRIDYKKLLPSILFIIKSIFNILETYYS